MVTDDARSYLGRGWRYPVGVDKATGRIGMSEYEQDIEEAISIILSTRRGERLMQPQFGSGLHSYLFDPADYSTQTKVEKDATDAITEWEPRVEDVSVAAEFAENGGSGFMLNISYVVRGTNNPYNMVYPYFLTEGN